MRKLAAILVLGVVAAVPLAASGGAAADTLGCPGQSTYVPNQADATGSAALTAALAANGLSSVSADGTFTLRFTSQVCGGFRFVVRTKEIRKHRDGSPFRGSPRGDGYTTLVNSLTHISAGPTSVSITFSNQGLALLEYARRKHRSLTVFVISHVRPDKQTVSSEALQIGTLS